MEFIPFLLVLVAIPFVLPLGLWVALYRTRTRLTLLEEALGDKIEQQNRSIAQLSAAVAQLRASTPRVPVEGQEPPGASL